LNRRGKHPTHRGRHP